MRFMNIYLGMVFVLLVFVTTGNLPLSLGLGLLVIATSLAM